MKRKVIKLSTVFGFVFGLLLMFAVSGAAGDYEALKGVNKADTVFDFRDGDPANALVHLSLVLETYKDEAIQAIAEKPHFVVVFMDSSVKLLSSKREAFTDEARKKLAELDKVISAIAREEHMKMEVCLYAVNFFGVNPESISEEIDRVPNGWISLLGYQARGYSTVPAF